LDKHALNFSGIHSGDDLVRKDFVDVCGDLNVVIGIISAINLFSARFCFYTA
jgi:hypothetical protein